MVSFMGDSAVSTAFPGRSAVREDGIGFLASHAVLRKGVACLPGKELSYNLHGNCFLPGNGLLWKEYC